MLFRYVRVAASLETEQLIREKKEEGAFKEHNSNGAFS